MVTYAGPLRDTEQPITYGSKFGLLSCNIGNRTITPGGISIMNFPGFLAWIRIHGSSGACTLTLYDNTAAVNPVIGRWAHDALGFYRLNVSLVRGLYAITDANSISLAFGTSKPLTGAGIAV